MHTLHEALLRPARAPDIDLDARADIARRQAEIAATLERFEAAIHLEKLGEAAH